jgi:hypothetical protein
VSLSTRPGQSRLITHPCRSDSKNRTTTCRRRGSPARSLRRRAGHTGPTVHEIGAGTRSCTEASTSLLHRGGNRASIAYGASFIGCSGPTEAPP